MYLEEGGGGRRRRGKLLETLRADMSVKLTPRGVVEGIAYYAVVVAFLCYIRGADTVSVSSGVALHVRA